MGNWGKSAPGSCWCWFWPIRPRTWQWPPLWWSKHIFICWGKRTMQGEPSGCRWLCSSHKSFFCRGLSDCRLSTATSLGFCTDSTPLVQQGIATTHGTWSSTARMATPSKTSSLSFVFLDLRSMHFCIWVQTPHCLGWLGCVWVYSLAWSVYAFS